MVIICSPFLGKMNNRSGKYDADDDANDVPEECYEEANPLGVVLYNICDVVTHLDTTSSPDCGEEYPRPAQHDVDASQEAHVIGSGTKKCSSSRIRI